MSSIGDLVIVVANFLDLLLTLYSFIVIAAALISWINLPPYNPIVKFLYGVTEPLLNTIRKLIPWRMPIDISPLILLFIIYIIQLVIISNLIDFGHRLKGGLI